jgi:hypothetical protein
MKTKAEKGEFDYPVKFWLNRQQDDSVEMAIWVEDGDDSVGMPDSEPLEIVSTKEEMIELAKRILEKADPTALIAQVPELNKDGTCSINCPLYRDFDYGYPVCFNVLSEYNKKFACYMTPGPECPRGKKG